MRTHFLCQLFVFIVSIVFLTFLSGCHDTDSGPAKADLVIQNADVFTSNHANPRATAVAVTDGRIAWVGSDAEAIRYIGKKTRIIDARGNMLTPGFVDNHNHLLWMGGLTAIMTMIQEAQTYDEMTNMVRRFAGQVPDFPFIIALGFKYDYLPGMALPDKTMADAVLDDRPLFLWSIGGQTGWLNSAAVDHCVGVNPEAFSKLSPQTNLSGDFTGILTHFHSFNPFDYFPMETLGSSMEQEIFSAMARSVQEALRYGVTTCNDAQIYGSFLPMLLKFRDSGGLDDIRVRGFYYIHGDALNDEADLLAGLADWIRTGEMVSNDHLRLGEAVKMYMDGVAGNRTSFLLDPYIGEPDHFGDAVWSQEDFDRLIGILDGLHLQACTHATGDAAARRIIMACEKARLASDGWDARHRIEHAEMFHPDDLGRMAEADIYAAMQFTHFFGMDQAGTDAFGEARIRERFMHWQDMMAASIPVSCGSDWMAGPINPMVGFFFGATRINQAGEINWAPEQAVPLSEGVLCYTIRSAEASKMEDIVGSLEPGKKADMVLFSVDLTDMSTWGIMSNLEELPLENIVDDVGHDMSPLGFSGDDLSPDILDGKVIATFVDGRMVYLRDGESL